MHRPWKVNDARPSLGRPGTASRKTPERRKRRIRLTIGFGILVAIFGLMYSLVLQSFFSDATRQKRGFTTGLSLGTFTTDALGNTSGNPFPNFNGVFISGNVISVDPDARTMTVRLYFTPFGTYAGPTGELKDGQPLALVVNSVDTGQGSAGGTEHQFKDGQVMGTQLVTVALSGEITNYPFDQYEAQFSSSLQTNKPGSTLANQQEVPTETQLHVVKNGYKITPTKYFGDSSADNIISLRIDRATSSRFFAVFIMVLMWAIALAAVAIALVLTRLGEDIGPGVLGFLGALLFALPNMRGALPGAPAIGSLNDYLAFFWAEALVAVTLVVLAVVFLAREWRSSHR